MIWKDCILPGMSRIVQDLYLNPGQRANTLSITEWTDGRLTFHIGLEVVRDLTREEFEWMKIHPNEVYMEHIL